MEFVVILPAFLLIAVSGAELGLLMTRAALLDRAVEVTLRELRLGQMETPDQAGIRAAICAETTMLPNCADDLLVELRPISTADWDLPAGSPPCADRSAEIRPATRVTPGTENEIMLIRVCALADPLFPTLGLGMQLASNNGGAYALISASAFVNEPSS